MTGIGMDSIPSSSPGLSDQEQGVPWRTHIILTGTFTIFASSCPSHTPPLALFTPSSRRLVIPITPVRRQHPVQITALAVDQSPPSPGHIRLVVCLSNGEFAVHEMQPVHSNTSVCTHTYNPPARTSRTAPITQAAYHHPLLVTLSQAFHLSIYDLSDGTVKLSYALGSFTLFPPSSLVLSMPEPQFYKLVLTYSTPVYPAHWSVGVTELIISSSPSNSFVPTPLSLMTSAPSAASSPLRLISTRSTRAFDVPSGWIDEAKLRLMHEQWSRKLVHVAGTQTDGKWVILAPDSPPTSSPSRHTYSPASLPLQLYRLSLPSIHAPSAVPKLVFVRHLYGQIGPVAALAVADGRCVSLAVNGSVWVWDLEGGMGTEVAGSAQGAEGGEESDVSQPEAAAIKGTVAFDDRRIITAGVGGIAVRDFDA
ncbi:hypothetical protein EW146_g5298 [Bondarzewia mesenterica]|uniref:Uncharacterized protein n=1 Tax=Bondarzewia mesenterica TaxID=1095465 RepID=A0A4S4LU09_9AGAM|nr:hypothetical protein EW146_g5298 [Bondarzewia mesenterica]